jgi:hypothetical protein
MIHNTAVIYHYVLTLEKEGTTINYSGISITLAPQLQSKLKLPGVSGAIGVGMVRIKFVYVFLVSLLKNFCFLCHWCWGQIN